MRITILISRERRENDCYALGGEAKATILDGYILDKKYFLLPSCGRLYFYCLFMDGSQAVHNVNMEF